MLFHPHRLVFRMTGPLTADHILQITQSNRDVSTSVETVDASQLPALDKAKSMVVFVDPQKPETILDHPLLGRVLKRLERQIFRSEKGKGGVPKKVLRQDPISVLVPTGTLGTVEHIHLVSGGTLENTPEEDEFDVPRAWRSAMGNLKAVLGDVIADEDQTDEVYIFLDERITQSPNAPHVLRALGTAVENLGYNTKHSKTPEEAQSVDGAPPEDPAAVDKFRHDIHDRALAAVHFVTDKKADNLDHLERVFRMGDREGQMQLLCRFLSEASENSLDAEMFVRVLAKLHEIIAEDFPQAHLTIYGEHDIDGLTINKDMSHMQLLKWVHQGSPEKGPFMVHFSWRPEGAAKGTKVFALKSMMFDSGGRVNKGKAGFDMQADMMAGAAGAAFLGRIKKEGASLTENFDLVWAVCSNRDGSTAREQGSLLPLEDGPVVEEANTDAEGREAVAQALRKFLVIAHKEGLKPDDIETMSMATLTGHSMVADGPLISVVSDQKKKRDEIEDLGRLNGEPVQTYRPISTDSSGLDGALGDVKNVVSPGPSGSPERGLQVGAAYIRRVAGMSPGMAKRHTHFDIASALDAWKKFTPGDVQGKMPAEGFLKTAWTLLTTPKGKNAVEHAKEKMAA